MRFSIRGEGNEWRSPKKVCVGGYFFGPVYYIVRFQWPMNTREKCDNEKNIALDLNKVRINFGLCLACFPSCFVSAIWHFFIKANWYFHLSSILSLWGAVGERLRGFEEGPGILSSNKNEVKRGLHVLEIRRGKIFKLSLPLYCREL